MHPFYLGIDLHLKRTYMVLMDAKGEPYPHLIRTLSKSGLQHVYIMLEW